MREFKTTVLSLLALRHWLVGLGVTTVAMEATGVSWRPCGPVLEEEFELLLRNAADVEHFPGRKPDTIDGQWIAQLPGRGLLRGSFVPPKPIDDCAS